MTPFVRLHATAEARARYEETVIDQAIPPYVDAVGRGVVHFSETGTPVVRNQFGAHDLYSPAAA